MSVGGARMKLEGMQRVDKRKKLLIRTYYIGVMRTRENSGI